MTDRATTTPSPSPDPAAARGALPRESYIERDGFDPEAGYEIEVKMAGERVSLALGETRRTGSFSEDAWALLTVAEARELAGDLHVAANEIEIQARRNARQEPAHAQI